MEAGDGIIGIGVDLVKITRVRRAINRSGDRFLSRILASGERQECPKDVALDEWVAGRFAVKEAGLKALGTGWAEGVALGQVRVLQDGTLGFSGKAGERADSLGVVNSRVSLTIQGDLIAAVVILDR